ncbi:MAG TPA: FliM/FliN family flagellar motor switch protein, partial [Kofleriaceae bacterium]|nr:FliM/FliN family flagellar motor switch protein [Kofleriaceae bacterium]
MVPNFSAYPFDRLRTLSRRDAQVESTIARWIAGHHAARGERLARLVGGTAVRVDVVPATAFDPFAARCAVRVGGAAIDVRGGSLGVRAIAQRLLGGPAELSAPRPLGVVEKSIFALVVATALEDLGVAGEVWPVLDEELATTDVKTRVGRPSKGPAQAAEREPIVELAITMGGEAERGHDVVLAVQIQAPADLLLRVPPSRGWPSWFAMTVDCPIVLGRCALDGRALQRLAVRSVVTLDRPTATAELDVLGGTIGLAIAKNAVVGEVATGYVPRDMSLPDTAHVELTVALGTTQLSLRQLGDLAIGQIVQLGRPLAGPFELRAAGRVVGRGELVDVDGELAVRIVSLGD